MEGLVSRSSSIKNFEFLRPFSNATEKTEKSCFALDQLYIDLNMKFVYNNQQCLASQTQMLTTSCRDIHTYINLNETLKFKYEI